MLLSKSYFDPPIHDDFGWCNLLKYKQKQQTQGSDLVFPAIFLRFLLSPGGVENGDQGRHRHHGSLDFHGISSEMGEITSYLPMATRFLFQFFPQVLFIFLGDKDHGKATAFLFFSNQSVECQLLSLIF